MDTKTSEFTEFAKALGVGLMVVCPIWGPFALAVIWSAPEPIPLVVGAIAGAYAILLTTRLFNRQPKRPADAP
jgi:hypothetical protein